MNGKKVLSLLLSMLMVLMMLPTVVFAGEVPQDNGIAITEESEQEGASFLEDTASKGDSVTSEGETSATTSEPEPETTSNLVSEITSEVGVPSQPEETANTKAVLYDMGEQSPITITNKALAGWTATIIIYANGNAIELVADETDSSLTKLYVVADDGTKKLVDLNVTLSGTEQNCLYSETATGTNLSNAVIFGGSNTATVASTSVTMTSGNVLLLMGGGHTGEVTGTTAVTINGGTIYVAYGGAHSAIVGKTAVTMNGGTVTSGLFGGHYNSDYSSRSISDIAVTITDGSISEFYGGSYEGGATTDNITVTMTAGNIQTFTAGGCFEGTDVDNITVDMKGGTIGTLINGGALSNTGQTTVNVSGGTITSLVTGGYNTKTGTATVNVSGGSITTMYGGSNFQNSSVTTSNLNISGGKAGNIYAGGGTSTDQVTASNISITDGTVTGTIYKGTMLNGAAPSLTITGGNVNAVESTLTATDGTNTLYKATFTEPTDSIGGSFVLTAPTGYSLAKAEVINKNWSVWLSEATEAAATYTKGDATVKYMATVTNDNKTVFVEDNTSPISVLKDSGDMNIFANGHAIELTDGGTDDAGNTLTKLYVVDGGTKKLVDLNSVTATSTEQFVRYDETATGTDLSMQLVYGGSHNTAGTSTSVTVSGGKIFAVLGGGCKYTAQLSGDTNVTITGGSINRVFGGGQWAPISGTAHITITGGTISVVYGGSGGSIYGTEIPVANTEITISGGTVSDSVYGGCVYSIVTGNAGITVTGGNIRNIYGGAYNIQAITASATIHIIDGTVTGTIYKGAMVDDKVPSLTITGGNVNAVDSALTATDGTNNLYKATFTEPTDSTGGSFALTAPTGYSLAKAQAINKNWSVWLPEAIKAAATYTKGDATVKYMATVTNDNKAVFVEQSPITITNKTLYGWPNVTAVIYANGNAIELVADETDSSLTKLYVVDGGTKKLVDLNVTLSGTEQNCRYSETATGTDLSNAAIFGGSNTAVVSSTSITMTSGNVFLLMGGGHTGNVTGTTAVTINGGTMNAVFGGAHSANVGETAVTMNGGTVIEFLFGGHYNVDLISRNISDIAVTITDGSMSQFYGGSCWDNAKTETITVTMTAGSIESFIAGGCWEGTDVGDITVDIQGGTIGTLRNGGDSSSTEQTTVNVSDGTIGSLVNGAYNTQTATATINVTGGNVNAVDSALTVTDGTNTLYKATFTEPTDSTGGSFALIAPTGYSLAKAQAINENWSVWLPKATKAEGIYTNGDATVKTFATVNTSGTATFVVDTTAPSITGVTEGETYYTTQKVEVSDDYLESITLNGSDVTSPFTLTGNTDATYMIVATDKAGNQKTVSVKMKPISSICTLTSDTVTSDDADDIVTMYTQAADLKNNNNTTDAEKAALDTLMATLNGLSNRIDAVQNTFDNDLIDTVLDINEDNVVLSDKQVLQDAKEQIENGLESFSGNLTETEAARIDAILDQVKAARNVIADVEAVITQLEALPKAGSATNAHLDAINKAKAAYNALTAHGKTLVPSDLIKRLTIADTSGDEFKDTTSKQETNATNTGDQNNLVVLGAVFALAAVGMGAVTARKRKRR